MYIWPLKPLNVNFDQAKEKEYEKNIKAWLKNRTKHALVIMMMFITYQITHNQSESMNRCLSMYMWPSKPSQKYDEESYKIHQGLPYYRFIVS